MFEDRVERGARLLDRVRPGWAREITQDELVMETCDRCLLGQLYGDCHVGFAAVLRPLPSSQRFAASDFGFTLPGRMQPNWGHKTMRRFAALADAWRAAIRGRLAREGDTP